jgi:hypothetical protein
LRQLPYKEPELKEKKIISKEVQKIIENVKKDKEYDFSSTQKDLDEKFYKIFNLDRQTIKEIENFCDNFYEEL